jgi:hypothetical protein
MDKKSSKDDASEDLPILSPFAKTQDVSNRIYTTERPHVGLNVHGEKLLPSPEYDFIWKSRAYHWLLQELELQTQINYPPWQVSSCIRPKILLALQSHITLHYTSSQQPVPIVHLDFDLSWKLKEYIKSLHLPLSPDIWQHILCLTGSPGDLQLATIAAYIRQTWPLSAGHLEHMLLDFLRCAPNSSCKCMYCDNSCSQSADRVLDVFPSGLRVELRERAGRDYKIRAFGGPYMVSEFAEQIAWLAATLRLSTFQDKVVAVSPYIVAVDYSQRTTSPNQDMEIVRVGGRLLFNAHAIDRESVSMQGFCWARLFTNPILVVGYPILRKSIPDTGLETTLGIIASLIEAHQVVRLDDKIVMKGFSSLLVATAVDGPFIMWHALTSSNPDGRISYFDPQIKESTFGKGDLPLLRSLDSSRHVIR